jgi:hypothetical protein
MKWARAPLWPHAAKLRELIDFSANMENLSARCSRGRSQTAGPREPIEG